jgi:hypothetical protein
MRQYASVAVRIQRIHNNGVLQHLIHYYTKGHELQMLTLHRDTRRMKSHLKQNHEYTCTGVCTIWIEDGKVSISYIFRCYEQSVQTLMVINSTNFNKTNNYLSL